MHAVIYKNKMLIHKNTPQLIAKPAKQADEDGKVQKKIVNSYRSLII